MNKFNVVLGSSTLLPNFVLGAPDPEMNRIEEVLTRLSIPFSHALFKGADGTWSRVHGGVAYKATEVGTVGADGGVSLHGVNPETLVFVECAVAGMTPVERLDHHNPSDRGYGAAPEFYWEASSLGQLYHFLKEWAVSRPALREWTAGHLASVFGADRLLLAASDHCPSHAFQGKCPGIVVEALRTMRRRNAATFQKKSFEDFDREVDAAVSALLALPEVITSAGVYRVSEGNIPQLNHAQLEAGVPVEYRMQGNTRDPRVKVGLLGGEPELIKLWMDSKAGSLVDIYGDPARGYAGGYLPG